MDLSQKRLYISKLPGFISKSDIESKFSHYGRVISVEIMQRKNGVQANQPSFAYVNLETSIEELLRCVRDFSNKQWKGEFVDVQVAKESFLDRLKREREEERNKQRVSDDLGKTQSFNNTAVEGTSQSYNGSCKFENKNRSKNSYFDEGNCSSFNGSVHEEKKEYKRKKLYFDEDGGDPKEEIVESDLPLNKSKPNDNLTEIPNKEDKSAKTDPKHLEADKKRISSMLEMRNQFRQQKQQIRTALSSVDRKATNKKIIFDQDIDEPVSNQRKNNKQLFEEDSDPDDDENEISLEPKPQFEGKQGHQLYRLQSRFQNDKRFVMNERFLENDDDVEENENDNAAPEDEKEKQLNILNEVLGKNVASKPKDVKPNKEPKLMLRFDPDDPQHKTYELARQKEEKSLVKKKKAKEVPEEPKPEVSKNKFYQVSDALKNVFQSENKSFSLLAARRDSEDEGDVEMRETNQQEIQQKPVKKLNEAFNNFSSDSEDEEIEEVDLKQQEGENPVEKQQNAADRVRFWSEPFFFKEDDFRFQEGMDFIKRMGSQENGDFLELRHDVKKVVRTKVKNINVKKDRFKKKLGGAKKRMRMKKALKR